MDLLEEQGKSWTIVEPLESFTYRSFYPESAPAAAMVAATKRIPPKPVHRLQELPTSIDPEKPPNNYSGAMKRPDATEREETYREE